MLDPIPILCLLLLLWLVVRDLSKRRSRSEQPLLPQHRDDVRYTVTLHDAEQRSVSEHQRRSAPPPKAQHVHLEQEQISSPEPLQTVQFSAPAVSQGLNRTPLQTSPQQVNEPVQSPVLVPQVSVSPTEPRRGAIQIYQATKTAFVPNAGGELSQLPQDGLDEGSGDYVRLRERAKQEVEAIRKYRKEKQQAKASGQLRLVEELAREIKKHKQRRQMLDEQATYLIFAKNNKNGSLDQVDLHGLTAKEAATYTKYAINEACIRGITKIRFIVGKGLHSSGPPVLKPSILKLVQKLKLPVKVDPLNEGVLVVQIIPANNAFPVAYSQEQNQTLLQPSLLQTSPPVQIPVLVPQVYASPTEPDQRTDDLSRELVPNCQEVSQLPQNSDHNDADGSDDFAMLREYAKQERKTMLNYRVEKKLARARGQMTLATELAEKESEHENRSEMLNAQASEVIFASMDSQWKSTL